MNSELHAFLTNKCFCSLVSHLLNTVLAVIETSLLQRLATIALRVGGRSKKDLYSNYLLLPFILHDIGKALELYQKNLLNHNYCYHEVFGALITYKIVREHLLDKEELDAIDIKKLVPLITYPVLYQHYAMRDIRKLVDANKVMYERIIKNRNYLVVQTTTLSNILNELSEKLARDVATSKFKEISEWMLPDILRELKEAIARSNSCLRFSRIDPQFRAFQDKMLREYLGYLSGYKQSLRELIEIHISSLTGLVNIADYLVAGIERRPCHEHGRERRGFVYRILSDEEIKKLAGKLVICREL